MRFGSIGVRLTAWYLSMLAVGLEVFGAGNWFAMRASAFHTIDEELEDRIRGVDKFMQIQIASLSAVEMASALNRTVTACGCDSAGRIPPETPSAM